jgi:hypothetical protein
MNSSLRHKHGYTSGDLTWYQNSGNDTFSAARDLGNAPGFRLMDI